jgi:hypothetical protein
MSETNRHPSAMRGHRVDAIHAHRETQLRTWLPWLIAGLAVLAVLVWALTTRRTSL